MRRPGGGAGGGRPELRTVPLKIIFSGPVGTRLCVIILFDLLHDFEIYNSEMRFKNFYELDMQ